MISRRDFGSGTREKRREPMRQHLPSTLMLLCYELERALIDDDD